MRIVTGLDMVEVERVQQALERHGRRFLERIYTPLEQAQAADSPASLAARFAAKEAVAKALGCGIGQVNWLEIEVQRQGNGQPRLRLSGAAAALAAELHLQGWSISLTHTHQYAAAVAVALAAGQPPD